MHAVAHTAGRIGQGVLRTAAWPVRTPLRFLIFIWLMGWMTVGWVQLAAADGIIVGPDLGATPDSLTVFEKIGPGSFTFYQRLSESQHGFPYLTEGLWNILNFLSNVIMFMLALLAQGAITTLQWVLNLTLYQDNKYELNAVVRSVANNVFWPLFATSLAIGAATAYGRMKREGGGSIFSDAAWLVATAVFAGAFTLSASNVLNDLDEARTLITDGMLTGYASTGIVSESAAGFPQVPLPTDTKGATRALGDAMFNTSVVAPWCYAQFGSLDDCKELGDDYLTQSDRWKAIDQWMADNHGDEDGAQCPPEISNCDWLRGQSAARLGAVLFGGAVSLPQDILQIGIGAFGIIAIVTFLLLILTGVFFLLLWPIPGKCREIGTRWFQELIGALLQSILLTSVIGAVMVLSALFTQAIPRYGLFGAAILQLATMIAGWRLRGTMENIMGVGSGVGGGSSMFSSMMATRLLGGLGRATKGLTKMGVRGAAGAGALAGWGAPALGRAIGNGIGPAGRTGLRAVRYFRGGDGLPSRPPRHPGTGAPAGRPVIQPKAIERGQQRPALPSGNEVPQLPAPGRPGPSGRHSRPELPAGGGPQPISVASAPTASTQAGTGHPGRFVAGESGQRRRFQAGTRRGTTVEQPGWTPMPSGPQRTSFPSPPTAQQAAARNTRRFAVTSGGDTSPVDRRGRTIRPANPRTVVDEVRSDRLRLPHRAAPTNPAAPAAPAVPRRPSIVPVDPRDPRNSIPAAERPGTAQVVRPTRPRRNTSGEPK